ncbi:hypothetical protein Tco_0604706 [Tanacetum coccineum]
MVKFSFALNVCKESSDTDEAAQYGGNPKSLTFEIHHDGCFTPTPSRSYVGGQRLGLDYGLHPLNVDADMLEMAKFVKDNKIILVKAHIEINSSPDVNKNLTPMCHRNLRKEWEQPNSSVEGPIVEETDDPFDGLDEILGDYANTREDITGKHMIVHVGNSSTVENVLDYDMIFETEGVGRMRFQRSGEDFYYDPKHDEVFDDDDEHILENSISSLAKRLDNFSICVKLLVKRTNGQIYVFEDPSKIFKEQFGKESKKWLLEGLTSSTEVNRTPNLRRPNPWISSNDQRQVSSS